MSTQQLQDLDQSVDSIVGDIERTILDLLLRCRPDKGKACRKGPGRPRILPTLCLWAALLICVLRGFTSQRAVWRLLARSTFWFYPRFPLTDQAIYNRLAAESIAGMETLFAQITAVLRERLAPFLDKRLAPFATDVMALDETALDPVARSLPALRELSARDQRLLPGKLAAVFDIRRQQWHALRYSPDVQQNEKMMARDMVAGLRRGSLILCDLGYFAFPWFDDLTQAGYYWISRLRQKTTYKVRHVYYQRGDILDAVVWLGGYRADRARYAVRLVCFTVGTTMYRYITNVLDPQTLSIQDIAVLYARRWDIELAVKTMKQHLNLHLLWSAKDVVIQQQVWAVLIIAQIVQALRVEIAGRLQVDPFEVSLQLLIEYAPQYAYEGENVVTVFVEQGRQLGFIRPSTRTTIKAPAIPLDWITPLPLDLELEREPRYAHRE